MHNPELENSKNPTAATLADPKKVKETN